MSQQQEEFRKMTVLAEQAAAAAARGSAASLSLLLTEMQALCALLPGMAAGGFGAGRTAEDEERARQVEAEVEASFDNMPV